MIKKNRYYGHLFLPKNGFRTLTVRLSGTSQVHHFSGQEVITRHIITNRASYFSWWSVLQKTTPTKGWHKKSEAINERSFLNMSLPTHWQHEIARCNRATASNNLPPEHVWELNLFSFTLVKSLQCWCVIWLSEIRVCLRKYNQRSLMKYQTASGPVSAFHPNLTSYKMQGVFCSSAIPGLSMGLKPAGCFNIFCFK